VRDPLKALAVAIALCFALWGVFNYDRTGDADGASDGGDGGGD
jgi:hypothetical protein